HTRSKRDWSSDVCSSDLIVDLVETGATLRENGLQIVEVIAESSARFVVNRASYQLKAKFVSSLLEAVKAGMQEMVVRPPSPIGRSEERRVGKECRVWLSA